MRYRERDDNMDKLLLLLAYWLAPLVPITVTVLAFPGRYATFVNAVPMIIGAMAFTWFMAQLVLSARIRWIERRFGLDRLLRVHALTPILAIVLAFVHKLTLEDLFEENLKTQLGDAGLLVFASLSALALLFMGDLLVRWVKPFGVLRKRLATFGVFRYGAQRLLHNLAPIGAVPVFLHVMLSSSARYSLPVRLVYITGFTVAAGAWLWHRVLRPAWIRRRPFTVRDVIRETADIWTLRLSPAPGHSFRHEAGQFGFLRFLTGALTGEPHPFSLSSIPDESGTISMTIKDLGDFTHTIGQVKPGDKAVIDGPYGTFVPSRHGHGKLVLLAGGVGITPMLSILAHLRRHDPKRPVLLVWGINGPADILRRDEWPAMQAEMPGFRFVPVAFRDPAFDGEKGVIDQARLERLTRDLGFDGPDTGYYVCGPAAMLLPLLKALARMGIPGRNIHYERFSL